jgi:N-acetylmuramoyl-L-alanine amidase
MAGIRRLIIIGLIGLISVPFAYSQDRNHLRVSLKPGDGISTLLNRYHLARFDSNVDSFLSLNGLERGDNLILERQYTLPIFTYRFNGKTIRESTGIDSYKQALAIQNFNDSLSKWGVKPDNFRKSKELWVPYHLYYSFIEPHTDKVDDEEKPVVLPDPITTEDFPIFGEDYRSVPILDKALEGHVYYLVSGHGGPDPGAMTKKEGNPLCEDEYAYDVTLRLARNLISHGAKVYIIIRDENDGIRDKEYLGYDRDEVCWPNDRIPANHRRRLHQRTAVINDLYEENKGAKVQRVLAIHVDSRYIKEKIDIFFYHFPNSSDGKSMATDMLTTIKSEYDEHQKSRGYTGVVKDRDLWVLRETKPPVVYIELGNITNDFDQKRLLIVNNRQAIANWLCLGVLNHFD